MSARPREDEAGTVEGRRGRASIIRINPLEAETSLFEKLQQQVAPDGKIENILEELSDIETGPERVAAIVHIMMRQFLSSPLGYIIPPETGAQIVKDRIAQNVTILLGMLKEYVEEIENKIEAALREGKEYEIQEEVSKLTQLHEDVLIAAREIMNRYLSLYMINMPPNLRPPLAQIKLGMEIISG